MANVLDSVDTGEETHLCSSAASQRERFNRFLDRLERLPPRLRATRLGRCRRRCAAPTARPDAAQSARQRRQKAAASNPLLANKRLCPWSQTTAWRRVKAVMAAAGIAGTAAACVMGSASKLSRRTFRRISFNAGSAMLRCARRRSTGTSSARRTRSRRGVEIDRMTRVAESSGLGYPRSISR